MEGEILAYFYCDFQMGKSISAVEVMCSLLTQLIACLCVTIIDLEDVLNELIKNADSQVDPFYTIKRLSAYLSRIARLCSQKPLVIVDALNECREVETLLDGLIESSRNAQIFVTSRPLQHIIQMLSHLPSISMYEMVHKLLADILLHVTRELNSQCQLKTFNGRLKEEIQSQLCAKADGM
ncbi:hypothetical protein J3R82DRAFT_3313 [Butyriboletus roseoflavus]|nr:hypothetical protein J3R82DRAFT_3313 [Butyriboletus roseoflavus]